MTILNYRLGCRTRNMHEARALLGDARLMEFLRSVRPYAQVGAVGSANDLLDNGATLGSLLATTNRTRFQLRITQRSRTNFDITFGTTSDTPNGDGATWRVVFDTNGHLNSTEPVDFWKS